MDRFDEHEEERDWRRSNRRRRRFVRKEEDGPFDYSADLDQPRGGAVTGVAILNFVAGGLLLVCGPCGLLINFFLGEMGQLGGLGLPGLGGGGPIIFLLVVALFLWSGGAIAAGVGLLYRANWARILSLILGGFAGMVGVLYVVAGTLSLTMSTGGGSGERGFTLVVAILGTGMFLGYCLWSYLVLLNPKYGREFR